MGSTPAPTCCWGCVSVYDGCRTIPTRQVLSHRQLDGSIVVMVSARQFLEGPSMLGLVAVVWLGLLVTGFIVLGLLYAFDLLGHVARQRLARRR
jgi:hypothetical protein